jgi:hypothetical protein
LLFSTACTSYHSCFSTKWATVELPYLVQTALLVLLQFTLVGILFFYFFYSSIRSLLAVSNSPIFFSWIYACLLYLLSFISYLNFRFLYFVKLVYHVVVYNFILSFLSCFLFLLHPIFVLTGFPLFLCFGGLILYWLSQDMQVALHT